MPDQQHPARRSLVSIAGLSQPELAHLVDLTCRYASDSSSAKKVLAERTVGLWFQRPSTRTRTSFLVAAQQLGGATIEYRTEEMQITTGESPGDTVRVLSGYLDALVIRCNSQEQLAEYAENGMLIVNALTNEEHPTQAIADLATIRQVFSVLSGIHVLFMGEGGNIAASFILAVAGIPGMRLTLITPAEYGLSAEVAQRAYDLARRSGASIDYHHDPFRLPRDVDVVYTTRWRSMGQEKQTRDWRKFFEGFRVTRNVMRQVGRSSSCVFLHDLPAERGQEVDAEVIDGEQSVVFLQAKNKLNSAKAALTWCLTDST